MIKKVFNWSFGAFFRTIGRILAYLSIGFLLAIVCSKLGLNLGYIKVNASTISTSDNQFNMYYSSNPEACIDSKSVGYKDLNTSIHVSAIDGNDYDTIKRIDYLSTVTLTANTNYTLSLIQSYNPKDFKMFTEDPWNFSMEGSTTTSTSNLSADNILNYSCNVTNVSSNKYQVKIVCNLTPKNSIKKLWLRVSTNCHTFNVDYFNTYSLVIESNSETSNAINNQTDVIKDQTDKINDSITSDSDDDESSKCGIICKLKTIVKFLKPTSLSNLIIPNEDQMHDLMDTMQTQVTSKLGILGFPITLYTQMIDLVQNVSDTNWCIDWPDVSVPNFEDHNIIAAGQFCFSSILQNEKINAFRVSCHLIIGALILLAFVQFLKNCYNRVLDLPDREEYTYFTTEDVYSVSANGETELKQVRNRSTYREKR